MQTDYKDVAYTCLDKQELLSFQENIITDTNHSFTSKNYKPDEAPNTNQGIKLKSPKSLTDISKNEVPITQENAQLSEDDSNPLNYETSDKSVVPLTSKMAKYLLQIKSIDKVTAVIITVICLIIIGVAVFHFTKPSKTNKSTTTAKGLRVDQVDNDKPKPIEKVEPEPSILAIQAQSDKSNSPDEVEKAKPAPVVIHETENKIDPNPDELGIIEQDRKETLDEVVDYEDFIKESAGTVYRES